MKRFVCLQELDKANELPNIHLETTQMMLIMIVIFKVIFGVSEFGTTLEQQQKSTTIS
jgi:hypothetical protein